MVDNGIIIWTVAHEAIKLKLRSPFVIDSPIVEVLQTLFPRSHAFLSRFRLFLLYCCCFYTRNKPKIFLTSALKKHRSLKLPRHTHH